MWFRFLNMCVCICTHIYTLYCIWEKTNSEDQFLFSYLAYICLENFRHPWAMPKLYLESGMFLFRLSHQSCNRRHRKPSASLLFSWNSIAPGPSLEASAETQVSLFDSKYISIGSLIEMYFGSIRSHSCSAPSWQGLVTVTQASQFLLSHLGWILPGA